MTYPSSSFGAHVSSRDPADRGYVALGQTSGRFPGCETAPGQFRRANRRIGSTSPAPDAAPPGYTVFWRGTFYRKSIRVPAGTVPPPDLYQERWSGGVWWVRQTNQLYAARPGVTPPNAVRVSAPQVRQWEQGVVLCSQLTPGYLAPPPPVTVGAGGGGETPGTPDGATPGYDPVSEPTAGQPDAERGIPRDVVEEFDIPETGVPIPEPGAPGDRFPAGAILQEGDVEGPVRWIMPAAAMGLLFLFARRRK